MSLTIARRYVGIALILTLDVSSKTEQTNSRKKSEIKINTITTRLLSFNLRMRKVIRTRVLAEKLRSFMANLQP